MINESQYYRWSIPLIDAGETVSYKALSRIRAFAVRAVNSPETLTRFERQVLESMRKDLAGFGRTIRTFSDKELVEAYIAGINDTNGVFKKNNYPIRSGQIPAAQVFAPGQALTVSDEAMKLLTMAGYPNHGSYVGAFQQALINDAGRMQFQILRSVQDNIRAVQIEATTTQFLASDTLTRRAFMQEILNGIADNGITGIIYDNGRRVSVEAYSEMLARTTLGNSARQAGVNRSAELGNDLVRASTHARCSPMCEPWQGGVYSLSGASDKYPPLSEAVDGGFSHPNCKHSVFAYFEGVSPALDVDGTLLERRLGDDETYKQEQIQRYNERSIRKWKARETVAIEPSEKAIAKAKVSEWQQRQRQQIKDNPYLKRQYAREQIN